MYTLYSTKAESLVLLHTMFMVRLLHDWELSVYFVKKMLVGQGCVLLATRYRYTDYDFKTFQESDVTLQAEQCTSIMLSSKIKHMGVKWLVFYHWLKNVSKKRLSELSISKPSKAQTIDEEIDEATIKQQTKSLKNISKLYYQRSFQQHMIVSHALIFKL